MVRVSGEWMEQIMSFVVWANGLSFIGKYTLCMLIWSVVVLVPTAWRLRRNSLWASREKIPGKAVIIAIILLTWPISTAAWICGFMKPKDTQ
jgi:hypothetical protein